jgi:hypothetical protein
MEYTNTVNPQKVKGKPIFFSIAPEQYSVKNKKKASIHAIDALENTDEKAAFC